MSCASPSTSGRNDASGATSDVINWGTCGGTKETGPEFAHYFTPTGPGPYTIQAIGLYGDLDMFLIEAPSQNTCEPTATCVASSKTAGMASESMTFTADPTKRYYIVLDGYNGAISPYTLAITAGCPFP